MRPTILHLRQSNNLSGPDRYLQQLAQFLPHEGYDMEILLLQDHGSNANSQYDHFSKALCSAPIERIPAHISYLPKVIKYLLKRIKARPVRLLHAHEFKSDIIGWAVSKLTGIPQIVTDHGQSREDLLLMKLLRAAGMWAAKQSAHIIAPSQHQSQLLSSMGIPAEKISLVYNGIDAESLISKFDIGRARLRASLGISQNEFTILSMARLDPQKDQETLITAFSLVTKHYSNVRLLLIGSGEEKWCHHLQYVAKKLMVFEKILFLGFRSDIADLLGACDLFVMSSRMENCPYALMEAMIFRKVIVSTCVGGVPELLGENKAGLLVKPADADEMSRAILALINNPDGADKLAANAYQIAKDRFSAQVMVRSIANIYNAVCREAGL